MSLDVQKGDRVVCRERPWRVVVVKALAGELRGLELEALDDEAPRSLELDAKKRNWLQARGWAVLVFWGRTILRDPAKCAAEVAQLLRSRAS